jgi:phospholipase C
MRPAYRLAAAVLLAATAAADAAERKAESPEGLERIGHILVIYLENHSFDNLYGLFPGADGIAQAKPENTLQTDKSGRVYDKLPPVPRDARFPEELPNRPFEIDAYASADEKIGSPTHLFYTHQAQINGGKMDRFAALSEEGGLVMGYYDGRKLPLWSYARRFVLADRFFQAAFGGSFLNHLWLACACAPRYEDAPESLRARLDEKGKVEKDGAVTPDGYAVNTLFPAQGPHPAGIGPNKLLPAQTQPTLGDRLSEKGVDWAWYAGGWNDAEAGRPAKSFQFHHQPYAYFQAYAPGTEARARHLRDEKDLRAGIEKGELPPVVFYKPVGELNEHPGYADLLSGDQHVADLLAKLERSKLWKDSLVIVTYDENGGFWDHAAPPKLDRWGPGSRVPALIISPFAKRGYVDHTVYDTSSLLKLIETRFGLAPLGERDAAANDLSNALRP